MSSKYVEAVALGLPNQDSPPVIAAKGELDLAQHIVSIARRHGIPVVEKDELCSSLGAVPLDEAIPLELFEVAATVLAEVGALTEARSSAGGTKRPPGRVA